MNQLIKLTGVTFDNRQTILSSLSLEDTLYLERDYFNKFDKNAIGVFNMLGESIGWIPKEVAVTLAPRLDNGEEYIVSINKILGGGNYQYGVEVSLNSESYREEKQKARKPKETLDVLDVQIEEELESIKKLPNETMQRNHEIWITKGNINELVILIKNEELTLTSIKLFVQSCFNSAEFEDCFKSLLTLQKLALYFKKEELLDFCNENLEYFISFGYHQDLPAITNLYNVQSIEKSDEAYDELTRIYKAKESKNMRNLMEILEMELKSENTEVIARALFSIGELHFMNNRIDDAINFYKKAIEENSNKALYWGYTAQLMHRSKYPACATYRFISRAIILDPKNPRWHFLKANILLMIGIEEENHDLLMQYKLEIDTALKLCRYDQKALQGAILLLIKNVENFS